MTFISYPFRFLMDNYMQVLVTIFIEINFQNKKYNSESDGNSKAAYLLSTICGGFALVGVIILLWIIIILTLVKMCKDSKGLKISKL